MKLSEILDDRYAHSLDEARCVGIDIGSRGAKIVLLYDGEIYSHTILSGVSSEDTANELLDYVLSQAGIGRERIKRVVGTGYGRVAMDIKGIPFEGVTEITCHAMGAHYLNANTRTIIDIGGQDSKAILVDTSNGNVRDFVMNDKCAAGTGRFLEKVAQLLDVQIDELGELALESENPIDISSQCVVFAESEVVSLRAKGAGRADIAAGIHLANARRVKNLLRRTGFEKDILFTGGVSHNRGMIKALETVIETDIASTKFDTVYAGALGAAVFASRN